MYGKVKNIWDIKSNGGGSSIDTENFASKIQANTFTGKNIFENTGNVISIKTTDDQAFGIEFKDNDDQHVGFVGTKLDGQEQKAVLSGVLGLQLYTNNKDINITPGSGHVLSKTTKNWNQHVDDSIVRQKDTKYNRKVDYTSSVAQPTTSWNYDAWRWTLTNINTEGLHDFLVVFSFSDNKAVSFKTNIVWKNGVPESQSNVITVEKSGITFSFQCAIKTSNMFHIYHKKSQDGGSDINISWVRVYILRDNNLPTKMSSVW